MNQSPESPRELRLYLMRSLVSDRKQHRGIVRNWLNSNEVAILDIHIIRAGQLMNLYSLTERGRHTLSCNGATIPDLASAIGIPASEPRALICQRMRRTPRLVARVLASSDERQTPSRDVLVSAIQASPVAIARNGRSQPFSPREVHPLIKILIQFRWLLPQEHHDQQNACVA